MFALLVFPPVIGVVQGIDLFGQFRILQHIGGDALLRLEGWLLSLRCEHDRRTGGNDAKIVFFPVLIVCGEDALIHFLRILQRLVEKRMIVAVGPGHLEDDFRLRRIFFDIFDQVAEIGFERLGLEAQGRRLLQGDDVPFVRFKFFAQREFFVVRFVAGIGLGFGDLLPVTLQRAAADVGAFEFQRAAGHRFGNGGKITEDAVGKAVADGQYFQVPTAEHGCPQQKKHAEKEKSFHGKPPFNIDIDR